MENHRNKKYTFSTEAFINRSVGGVLQDMPHGILGLTDNGRIELILDNGKVMFSAPVALTIRQYRLGYLRIVVGPRHYELRFSDFVNSRISPGKFGAAADSLAGREIYAAWKEKLEGVASHSADSEPIIAAVTTPHMKKISWVGQKALSAIMGSLFAGIALYAVFVSQLGEGWGWLKTSIAIIALLVYALFIYPFIMDRRSATLERLHKKDNPSLEADDVLPAGTKPTGKRGMSVRAIMLWIFTPFLLYAVLGAMAVHILGW